ncbi:MAG: hypothetical protein M0C28_35245 [Candidatus Moduliflexus flocculans]|nr:hypothetical protein [Candidatus Moduliflexus flocculans]
MVAVKVPTIDKRKRIPQKAIDQVVEQIVEKFKPQKIIRNRARTRAGIRARKRDVDMLAVMDTPLRGADQSLAIHRHLNVMFGLDGGLYPKRLKERVKMREIGL